MNEVKTFQNCVTKFPKKKGDFSQSAQFGNLLCLILVDSEPSWFYFSYTARTLHKLEHLQVSDTGACMTGDEQDHVLYATSTISPCEPGKIV